VEWCTNRQRVRCLGIPPLIYWEKGTLQPDLGKKEEGSSEGEGGGALGVFYHSRGRFLWAVEEGTLGREREREETIKPKGKKSR